MQKKRIGVGTLFRDSQVWHTNKINQVDRFFRQIDAQTIPNEDMLIVASVGKSKDNTVKVLMQEEKKRDNLFLLHDHSSVKSPISSTCNQDTQPARLRDLSLVADTVLDELAGCDYVFWQESDLIFPDNILMESLISSLDGLDKAGIVAPPVMMEHRKIHFYDTWGFRSTNRDRRWTCRAPHSADYAVHKRFIPMNSIGSCCMMRGHLLTDGVRFSGGAFVELCTQVRELGHKIYVDKNLRILHPSKIGFIEKRWI